VSNAELRSELMLFDVTNLVVGSIIGADIYVASTSGASHGEKLAEPYLEVAPTLPFFEK